MPGLEGSSASGASLPEGRQGEAPVVPQTQLGASSDTDMDLEAVKQTRSGRKQKKRKKQ